MDDIRNKIQEEAYTSWINAGKIGTVEMATGNGKTFVAFKAILSMPKGSNILFLAETTVRENTVLQEANIYKSLFKIDPLKGYNFKFACYQASYKYSLRDYFPNANRDNTIIIFDEIHDLLSTERFRFITNSNLYNIPIPRLGLSATIDKKTEYIIGGEQITKHKKLMEFCPVIYTYSLQESIENKTTRDIRFFVLMHGLDNYYRKIKAGSKSNPFFTTELSNYGYLDSEFKKVLFTKAITETEKKNKEYRVINAASKRARFLYSLPSKIELCKKLIQSIEGKTLIFGQDSQSLLEICPTAIVDSNPNKNLDLQNFKLGKTRIGASNKILRQGENIPDLRNIVLFAYNSKVKEFIQMIGRLRKDSSVGNVIIIMTKSTQEESWFRSMTEELNVNFTYCPDIESLKKVY